jgi:hypothetical protein
MSPTSRVHFKPGVLLALGLICGLILVVTAADREFAGKWKGEMKAPAPVEPGGASQAGAPTAGSGGGGGRFGGGGGRFGGGFGAGGFNTGPQKVTLNLKQSKDKVSGNITIGTQTEDVKDGRLSGNTITFKSGRAPQVYEYIGELNGEELRLTRHSSDGRTRPQEIILRKN